MFPQFAFSKPFFLQLRIAYKEQGLPKHKSHLGILVVVELLLVFPVAVRP